MTVFHQISGSYPDSFVLCLLYGLTFTIRGATDWLLNKAHFFNRLLLKLEELPLSLGDSMYYLAPVCLSYKLKKGGKRNA